MTQRRYKRGIARDQISLLPARIEDYISTNAVVRAVDAYVSTLDLLSLGFCHADGGHRHGNGQPPYDPADHLRLYLYGYMNKVRSSRALERECWRNLEVIWLLGSLRPDHKTIADFRKNNGPALKAVNRDFVLLCRELGLLGGRTVAIDGSFFEGNVSKKSFVTASQLDQELAQLDLEIERYQKELAETDKAEAKTLDLFEDEDRQLPEKLIRLQQRQKQKQELKDKLETSGNKQISTTDEDARKLYKGNGTVTGFNVQIAVDDKAKVIVASEVTADRNDQHQLASMANKAQQALGVTELEALADAGYYNTKELAACEQSGITALVPEPNRSAPIQREGRFTRDAFTYDSEANIYVCPQGQSLKQQGNPHLKNGRLHTRYAARAGQCQNCPLRADCLPEKTKYRQIYRSEFEDVAERHRARMQQARGKMSKRAGLVEHPFGTLKCRAGWTHFLVRGFEKVKGEWALMVLGYNFSRVLNIIGFDGFLDYCRKRRINSTFICPAVLKSPSKCPPNRILLPPKGKMGQRQTLAPKIVASHSF